MDKIQILEQLSSDKNLLSLPQVLAEIITETTKEDVSPEKLGNIILKDPSLTGKILKMANSSFYNRYVEIKTVHQAISMMGMTTVKCLALSASIFHPDKISKTTSINPKEFFSYILSVAAASKRIATEIEFKSVEEAFVAGLLHDIGHLVIMTKYPDEMKKILKLISHGKSLTDAEKEVLGLDHSEISSHIARNWKIPEEIVESIDNHHSYTCLDNKKLKNIVKLAVLLTRDSFTEYQLPLQDRLNGISLIAKKLEISQNQIDDISSSLLTDTYEIAQYLGIDIGDIEQMLSTANQEIWKSYLLIENLFKERQQLSECLLNEERERGAIESKNIAMATLSHYLNNATMAIFGRTQILRMRLNKSQTDKILESLPDELEKIDASIKKIVAVIEEMKNVSPIDQKKFDHMSKAMNIDDLIKKRLEKIGNNFLSEEIGVPQ